MSIEVEFRLAVGRQYEYVNVRVSAEDPADLARQLNAFGDGDGLNIGFMQSVLSGVVRHGHDNPGAAPIEKDPPPVTMPETLVTPAHAAVKVIPDPIYGLPSTDERTPQQLVEQELGGKVVAVQEQAAEAPQRAWEVTLPSAPKEWEKVAIDAVKAQATVEYPSGPPVESPKEDFPF